MRSIVLFIATLLCFAVAQTVSASSSSQSASPSSTGSPTMSAPTAIETNSVNQIPLPSDRKKAYKWFSRVIPFSQGRQEGEDYTFAEAIQDGLIWGILWDGVISFYATALYHISGYHIPTWITSAVGVQIEWFSWANVGVQTMQGMFYALFFVAVIKVVRTIIYSFESERHFLESPRYADSWGGDIIYYEGVRRTDIDHLFGLSLIQEVEKEKFETISHFRYFVHNGVNMNYMATVGRKYKTTIYTDILLPAEYPLKGKKYRLEFVGLKDNGTRYTFHVSHRFGFRKEFRPYFLEREAIMAKGSEKFLLSPTEMNISSVKPFFNSKTNDKWSVSIPDYWNGETLDFSAPTVKDLERIFRLSLLQGDLSSNTPDPIKIGTLFFFMRRPEEGGGLMRSSNASVIAATAAVISTNSPLENLHLVIETLDDDGKTKIVHVSKKFRMRSTFTNFFLERNRVMSKGLENLLLSGALKSMEDAVDEIVKGAEKPIAGNKATAILSRAKRDEMESKVGKVAAGQVIN